MQQQRRLTLDNEMFRGRVRRLSSRPAAAFSRPIDGMIRDSPRGAGLAYAARFGDHTSSLSNARSRPVTRSAAAAAGKLHTAKQQSTQNPKQHIQKRKSASSKKQKYLTGVTACLLLLIGGGLWFATIFTNRDVVETVRVLQASVATDDGNAMPDNAGPADYDETPPASNAPYSVAPELPRYLIIESLGVKSRVKRMGVTDQNAVQTPRNIFDTGWFDGSVRPGEVGAVFINGHVSGPTTQGVFFDLKELAVGAEIKLEKGDGTVILYSVVMTETYPVDAVDMNKVLRPYGNNTRGLNLMTCGGEFDRESNSYKERRVVYAIQK